MILASLRERNWDPIPFNPKDISIIIQVEAINYTKESGASAYESNKIYREEMLHQGSKDGLNYEDGLNPMERTSYREAYMTYREF